MSHMDKNLGEESMDTVEGSENEDICDVTSGETQVMQKCDAQNYELSDSCDGKNYEQGDSCDVTCEEKNYEQSDSCDVTCDVKCDVKYDADSNDKNPCKESKDTSEGSENENVCDVTSDESTVMQKCDAKNYEQGDSCGVTCDVKCDADSNDKNPGKESKDPAEGSENENVCDVTSDESNVMQKCNAKNYEQGDSCDVTCEEKNDEQSDSCDVTCDVKWDASSNDKNPGKESKDAAEGSENENVCDVTSDESNVMQKCDAKYYEQGDSCDVTCEEKNYEQSDSCPVTCDVDFNDKCNETYVICDVVGSDPLITGIDDGPSTSGFNLRCINNDPEPSTSGLNTQRKYNNDTDSDSESENAYQIISIRDSYLKDPYEEEEGYTLGIPGKPDRRYWLRSELDELHRNNDGFEEVWDESEDTPFWMSRSLPKTFTPQSYFRHRHLHWLLNRRFEEANNHEQCYTEEDDLIEEASSASDIIFDPEDFEEDEIRRIDDENEEQAIAEENRDRQEDVREEDRESNKNIEVEEVFNEIQEDSDPER